MVKLNIWFVGIEYVLQGSIRIKIRIHREAKLIFGLTLIHPKNGLTFELNIA